MTYREWAPPASLAGSVVCLWSRTESETSTPALVLPDGCVDLIWESGRGAFVAGPDTGPMPGTTEAEKTLLGVRLRPAAGGPVLGLPLDELCNRRVDLSELRPASARRLDGALPRASARRLDGDLPPAEALRRLLAVIGELVEERPPDPALVEAVRLLHDPRVRVHELSARLDIGDRQLRRRFTAAVGYGPKTLHRVLRFRRFLTLLASPGGLAELAVRAGYVDQAHLSRETAQLAGLPPAALARRWGRAV
ncbi:AraC family transcriptional regulator [Actinoplanes italicus]|uniref:AraC family transcriptional regulator n=1 Tax=Actinoplanes italicus TaxID=113567 RepID=A0A2T0K8E2_9ACTN|nr:helix-turn-helix domain-containing protein [Actinoplanes italicus]PRX19344.1 AraC family transcriptional regulator [Actinoplanes italicus]GIE30639.1 AraC family transcriptional regulator [Actinoplanes italicus]